MPGIILDESEDEEGEVSGDVNTLQARDMFFFFWKKTGSTKERLLGIPRLEEEEAKPEDRKYEQETNFLL